MSAEQRVIDRLEGAGWLCVRLRSPSIVDIVARRRAQLMAVRVPKRKKVARERAKLVSLARALGCHSAWVLSAKPGEPTKVHEVIRL